MAILNRYKDTYNNLIDSSDIKFPDWPRLINKGSCNISRSESSSIGFEEKDFLNQNI